MIRTRGTSRTNGRHATETSSRARTVLSSPTGPSARSSTPPTNTADSMLSSRKWESPPISREIGALSFRINLVTFNH
ncbi:UNVERIFIED_CONTAM: hypothetical protein PYX00_009063 [Menopon gallinae]|uniref:Uncharacterized protein n=1 Tax=Menopon gallinae TaxID=328185 RepID=A0AAW2HAH2_9NEOP